MAKVKVKAVPNKKPKQIGEGKDTVKTHNAGRVAKTKTVKPMNAKSNYGVKDSK